MMGLERKMARLGTAASSLPMPQQTNAVVVVTLPWPNHVDPLLQRLAFSLKFYKAFSL